MEHRNEKNMKFLIRIVTRECHDKDIVDLFKDRRYEKYLLTKVNLYTLTTLNNQNQVSSV